MMTIGVVVTILFLLSNSNSGSFNTENRGLIIQEPWFSMVLNGEKTMDLRAGYVNVRGRIAILNDGHIHAYADLVDVVGPLSKKELTKLKSKHRVEQIPSNYKYGWVFTDVDVLDEPIPYDHPQGAQIWVRL